MTRAAVPAGRDRASRGTPDGGEDPRTLRERIAETSWRSRIARSGPLGTAYRIGVAVAGAVVTAVGLALIPLPGPGWVIVFAGLFLWATEFAWAERLLEYARRRVRAWTDWVGEQALWVRVVVGLLTLAFVYGVVVLTLHLTGVPGWVPGWVPLWR